MQAILRALDASRVSRIFILTLPVALVLVALGLLINPTISGDELAASVAIPLMISYLLIRGVIWLVSDAPEPTPEQLEKMRRETEQSRTVFVLKGKVGFILALAFVSGMWALVTAGISLGLYEAMSLSWAASIAIDVLRVIFWVVATSAVFICLKNLCKPWLLKMAAFFRSVFRFPVPRHHMRKATW